MVESLATTTHSRPSMRAMPVISPAPWMASSYMWLAASGESSRKGEPGSISVMTRSRGRSFARARRPAGGRLVATLLELRHEFPHAHRIDPKLGRCGIDSGRQNRHDFPPEEAAFPRKHNAPVPAHPPKKISGTGTLRELPNMAIFPVAEHTNECARGTDLRVPGCRRVRRKLSG